MIESILLPDLTVKNEKSVVVNEVSGGVCHYQTGDYEPAKKQDLPENVCSQALDCIVGCSTSVLLMWDGKTLLGERRCYPQMNWWFPITGPIKPGLSPVKNCQKLCYQKLGLKLEDSSRLKFVGTYSFLWRMREVSPMENGKHEISVVYSANLTSAEIPKVYSLDEFGDMKWMKIEEVTLRSYHPALIRAIRDYQLANDLATLVDSVVSQEETDLSTIGKKLKLYCSKRLNRKQNKENDESTIAAGDLETLPEAQDLDGGSLKATDVHLGNAQNTRAEIDDNLSNIPEKNLETEVMITYALIDDQDAGAQETTAQAPGKIQTIKTETVFELANTGKLNDENTTKIQGKKVDENSLEEGVSANAITIMENLDDMMDMKNSQSTTAEVSNQNNIAREALESEEIKKISDESIKKISLEKDSEETAASINPTTNADQIENVVASNLSTKTDLVEKAKTPIMTELKKKGLSVTGYVKDPVSEDVDATVEERAVHQLAKEANVDESPRLNDEQKIETKTNDLGTENLEMADQAYRPPEENLEPTLVQKPESDRSKVDDVSDTMGNGKSKLNNEIVDETQDEQQDMPTGYDPKSDDQGKDSAQHIKSTKQPSENLDTIEVAAGGEIL